MSNSTRMARDVTVCRWAVIFHYFPTESLRLRHARIQERIPWAEAYARVAYGWTSWS
jgi:hypothetical protein